MKSSTKKSTWSQFFLILKWGKITAKIAAIGTTLTGLISAFTSSSAVTGIAMGAAGATTYAATKNLAGTEYEKTKHVAPSADLLKASRGQQAVLAAGVRKVKDDVSAKAAAKMEVATEKPALPAEENPFAWVEEDKAQQEEVPVQPDFLDRPPVMVVTMEEEEEVDETGTKVRKIRKTALNFVAPTENADAKNDSADDPIPV